MFEKPELPEINSNEILELVDSSLTDDDRVFIRKLEKFKDDLVTLLDEGTVRDIILEEVDNTDGVDFYSDRNRRQLGSKNPVLILKLTKPKELFEKHESEFREFELRDYESVQNFAKKVGGDDDFCQEMITTFLANIVNKELTRKITRRLYTVASEKFNYKIREEAKVEDEIDFILLFSSIFGITVQNDKNTLDKKKVFVRMIL